MAQKVINEHPCRLSSCDALSVLRKHEVLNAVRHLSIDNNVTDFDILEQIVAFDNVAKA